MLFASRLGFEVFCAKTQSSFYLEVWLKFEIVFSFFFRFALWDLQNQGALRSCIARWNLGLWNSKDSGECWKSCYVDVNTILCAQRYGVVWVSWNDKFCYLYRSSRSFNISPVILIFFYLSALKFAEFAPPRARKSFKSPITDPWSNSYPDAEGVRQFNFFDWELELFR